MNIEFLPSGETKEYKKNWQFCVGSGHAPLAQRADYLEQLKFIHDELGIERVRFHGVFNDDMNVGMTMKHLMDLPVLSKYNQISFFQIGRIYDNILALGMTPFVELSFMPSILASGKKQCSFKYGGNITMPRDLNEWSDFIRSFICYLVGRYGRDNVEQWYFEVWNEPNLGVFFAGSMQDYFKLYETTAKAVKSVLPGARVGGPATAADAWLDEFLSFVKDNHVPCDFLSTHQYPTDCTGLSVTQMALPFAGRIPKMIMSRGGTVLEGVRALFGSNRTVVADREAWLQNAAQAKEKAGDLPLIYSEWNVAAANTAMINDTRAAASFAVCAVLGSDDVIDMSSLWCFSEIFEEIEFFPEPFCGGFGMLTNTGIPKPLFYGMKLLSMLGDRRFVLPRQSGDTGWAAFRKGGTLQLLLWRQSFSTDSGEGETVDISAAIGKEPRAVSVYRIDNDHCNPLAEWKKIGCPMDLTKQQVELIKQRSRLTKDSPAYAYEDGRLSLTVRVYDNDVLLYEIDP